MAQIKEEKDTIVKSNKELLDLLQELKDKDYKDAGLNSILRRALDVIISLIKKMMFQELVLLRKNREIQRLKQEIRRQQIQIDTIHCIRRINN